MKKMNFLLFCLLVCFIYSCQKETIHQSKEISQTKNISIYQHPAWGQASSRAACDWTIIPAGSNNALADAIANTCNGGVIYLEPGEHTETEPLTISKSVILIGAGAGVTQLKVYAGARLPNPNGSAPVDPAFHFLNAEKCLIQDIDIQPIDPEGGTCMLLENAPNSAVVRCNISGFMFSIANELSDQFVAIGNTIVGGSAWLQGDAASSIGIVNVNGKSCYMADNEVSNHLFGLWGCDQWGTIERNFSHGCGYGVILCNVPMFITLPDGRIAGSLVPGSAWKVRNNNATDNFAAGFIVIDGANNNRLTNNNASNNVEADIILSGESLRFGFLTPVAYNNQVDVGAYPNITIKDCGQDNIVNGGVMIDTNVTPCL